jgi:UDP-glucose 4-epimerase
LKRALITGGAGFIGSTLADRLLSEGVEVVVYDNLSTGRLEFLSGLLKPDSTSFVQADVLDLEALTDAMRGCDTIFHLAANADVRDGLKHPRKDLEQNTIATSNVLEAMRANEIGRIVFASTGSVYGEPDVFPTPEDVPFPTQTSLYAASKLAGEGLIGAYCHGYGFTGVVYRFVSILGERYTHGHVYDFVRSLRADPERLRVLGDGRQEKSYLYVQDCVSAILRGLEHAGDEAGRFEIYNLGTDETVVVDQSVAIITRELGVHPQIEHTGGKRGWAGDSPLIHLDCSRIRSLGWAPTLTIEQGIIRTVQWLQAHPDVFEAREALAS